LKQEQDEEGYLSINQMQILLQQEGAIIQYKMAIKPFINQAPHQEEHKNIEADSPKQPQNSVEEDIMPLQQI